MKKLVVLANGFPYGTWESYMETEESFYSAFDKVWICSLQLRRDQARTIRPLQCGAKVIPVEYKAKIFYFFNSVTVLFDSSLYRELLQLHKQKRLSLPRMIDLFIFLSRSHHEAQVIDKALKSEDKSDILLYSYRFEYQPYVALLLKKKWGNQLNIVSRAHGYDLYEERHANNYIPLRNDILSKIDKVYPCSIHGVDYIKEHYSPGKAEIAVSYLGTKDHGVKEFTSDRKIMTIVSCSNMIKVKHLEKIIGALSEIHEFMVEWVHYGNGPLFDEIKRLAFEKLGPNIKASFPGNIPNKELLKIYSDTDYCIFLNVSSSEGVPVSIMEAGSFGIPCIATDVGGTRELVNKDNGVLLPANASNSDIASAIKWIYKLPDEAYMQLRNSTREYWNNHFNSDKNYLNFIRELLSL